MDETGQLLWYAIFGRLDETGQLLRNAIFGRLDETGQLLWYAIFGRLDETGQLWQMETGSLRSRLLNTLPCSRVDIGGGW